MWTLDELELEIDPIRERILQHRRDLKEYFVGRNNELDLAVLCAIAQEPLLLVGPPGTAKSDLIVKFTESLGLGAADYFEYMLTKFTEPSEILGPIDISLLKEGRYVRRTEGMLPECRVAFLDEVFKSNSAILNTLLTILNERKFYQDGRAIPVKLLMLFAATNEIPEQTELQAMADRFILKIETLPVKDRFFEELIDSGLMNDAHRASGRKPWARGSASLEDFLKMKRFMDLVTGMATGPGQERQQWFPRPVFAEMRRIIRALETEDKVFVSDRKLIKLYKLIRTQSFLEHGGAVELSDLKLLCYIGNRRDELTLVSEKVQALLGLPRA
jgi:MoxR-like ATPase